MNLARSEAAAVDSRGKYFHQNMYFLHARPAFKDAKELDKITKFAEMLNIITGMRKGDGLASRLLKPVWGKRYG